MQDRKQCEDNLLFFCQNTYKCKLAQYPLIQLLTISKKIVFFNKNPAILFNSKSFTFL